MKQIWAGEAVSAEVGPIGPRPVQDGGPPILIGGLSWLRCGGSALG